MADDKKIPEPPTYVHLTLAAFYATSIMFTARQEFSRIPTPQADSAEFLDALNANIVALQQAEHTAIQRKSVARLFINKCEKHPSGSIVQRRDGLWGCATCGMPVRLESVTR